jgi:hypothetical protein
VAEIGAATAAFGLSYPNFDFREGSLINCLNFIVRFCLHCRQTERVSLRSYRSYYDSPCRG